MLSKKKKFPYWSYKDKILSQRISDLMWVLGFGGFVCEFYTRTSNRNACGQTNTQITQICKCAASWTLTKQIQSPLRNSESIDPLINTHLTFLYTPSTSPPNQYTHIRTQTHTLLIHQQDGNEQTSPTLIYHSDWKWSLFDSTLPPFSLHSSLPL